MKTFQTYKNFNAKAAQSKVDQFKAEVCPAPDSMMNIS
jgi:hypothetical protein